MAWLGMQVLLRRKWIGTVLSSVTQDIFRRVQVPSRATQSSGKMHKSADWNDEDSEIAV